MRTLIIAEAGVNHNGSIELAKKLIDAAAAAGADYVKFQTFKSENLVSKSAKKADYQQANSQDNVDTQFEMLKKLELTPENHLELIDYCKEMNIKFLSTAFDLDSLDLLHRIGIRLYKIPSGEITNLPYLEKVADLAEKVVISTGMSTLEDISLVIQLFDRKGFKKENITILHCNTEYPTQYHDVNLNSMQAIKDKFGIAVGYSDHTLGIEIPVAAVALGATVIEKHFTLDRTLEGPDHKASLEPGELIQMVRSIRNVENALGSDAKEPTASELRNISVVRKSIHASRDIAKGTVITADDLVMLRPGDGVSPMRMYEIVGHVAKENMTAGQKLDFDMIIND